MGARKGEVRNPTGKGGWKKGCPSPNPGGRTKKSREIEEIAQQALEKGKGNFAVKALMKIAEDETNKPYDRMRAIELLMNYAYGKPKTRTEILPGRGANGEVWTIKFGDRELTFE
jgi:hypothetical protein